MSYVDYSSLRKALLRLAEPVTIESYSTQTYSDWGDLVNQTTTIYSAYGVFNTYGDNQMYNPEGTFKASRYSFFFEDDQEGTEDNNIIVRADGTRWKIMKTVIHASEGANRVKECAVQNG